MYKGPFRPGLSYASLNYIGISRNHQPILLKPGCLVRKFRLLLENHQESTTKL